MTKFYCFLTGYDYHLVKTDTPRSRRKVAALGSAMLIPVIVWAINGFLIAYMVLDTSLAIALISAVVCLLLITLLERLIVMANKSGWMYFIRFLLALLLSVLGALAIDEVVFHDDIVHQLNKEKLYFVAWARDIAAQQFDTTYELPFKKTTLEAAIIKYDSAEDKVIDEINGLGTGEKGYGTAAKRKERFAEERHAEKEALAAAYNSLLVAKDSIVNKAGVQAEKNFSPGLLTKIKALYTLVSGDKVAGGTYIVFFCVMLFMELAVVLAKGSIKTTNFERRMDMIEEIGDRRMRLLLGEGSAFIAKDYQLPQAKAARLAIRKQNAGVYR